MRAFLWLSRRHPEGLCHGATVGVAAERASDAARLVRRSGWHGIKPEDAVALGADDAGAGDLLAAPGVVMWRGDTGEDGEAWRRD